jgi:mono/diheme cytochrome c family protein
MSEQENENEHGHGSFKLYTILIVILGAVTFIEWQLLPGKLFYSEALAATGIIKPLLIVMSVGKFFAVVYFYMHLKFDAVIFKRLFIGVLCLAITCVMVVMAVLKSLPGGAHDMARVDLIRPVPPEIAAERAKTTVARSGEQVFNMVCVACHQADGTGQVGGTRLAADLTQAAIWAKGDEALLNSIIDGAVGEIGAMPAQRGALPEVEIKAVFAYIKATYSK